MWAKRKRKWSGPKKAPRSGRKMKKKLLKTLVWAVTHWGSEGAGAESGVQQWAGLGLVEESRLAEMGQNQTRKWNLSINRKLSQ